MPREKIFQAIANLEDLDCRLSNISREVEKTDPHQKEALNECRELIKKTIQYLEGVDIRMEIDQFSEME